MLTYREQASDHRSLGSSLGGLFKGVGSRNCCERDSDGTSGTARTR